MYSGRMNSKESLDTAARLLRAFGGSWEAVDRAATPDEDGVYVVRLGGIERKSGADREGDRA